MRLRTLRSPLVFSLLLLCITASAQSTGKKLEIGAQFTSLTLYPPDFDGFPRTNGSEPGFGGRITYNINDKIAVESELNFFPTNNVFQFLGDGHAIQGQFGVKAGKRFEHFGVFGKARPGFLSIGDVFSIVPGSTIIGSGFPLPNARIARKAYFTTDVGGVFELYPSRRTIVRFDAGDTIARFGPGFEHSPSNFNNLIAVPAKISHSFQFTVGVGFRLKDPSPAPGVSPNKASRHEQVPRYEVGVQFTSISFQPTPPICSGICLSGAPIDTEPGFGGRFTFNLNSHVAVEAEGNYLPRLSRIAGGGGHQMLTQFGGKVGKRWTRFGVFGKARPGMITFTDVSKLVRTQSGLFGTIPFTFGIFRQGWKSYLAMDVGGVMEFNVSRRLMTRIDIGDTVVHYSEFPHPGFSVSMALLRRPPETHHNFQFSAGVGFRF